MIGRAIQQLQPINTVGNLKPDHMCTEPSSKHIMSDLEELDVGDFDPTTYQHMLPEGAHDYDDYDSDYEQKHPGLGFNDAQVKAEVKKLNPEDRKFYEDYRDFLDAYYRQHGRIIEFARPNQADYDGKIPRDPFHHKEGTRRTKGKVNGRDQKEGDVSTSRTGRETPRKVRRVVPEMLGKIIDITGDDDPDAPTIIKITPGVDPYSQLDREEEELEYKVGDESTSEVHPDDDETDDLSCITLDSLKYIDNDKVKVIWKGMAKLKQQEGEYYDNLAGMVDKMTPEVIYQSVQATP